VAHEEVDYDRDGIDFMQELTLDVAHTSKVEQQSKVLRQVLALRPSVLLQLYNKHTDGPKRYHTRRTLC